MSRWEGGESRREGCVGGMGRREREGRGVGEKGGREGG